MLQSEGTLDTCEMVGIDYLEQKVHDRDQNPPFIERTVLYAQIWALWPSLFDVRTQATKIMSMVALTISRKAHICTIYHHDYKSVHC